MNKTYFVESEMCDRVGFQSESDRNEMALALYEEHIYFLTMRIMNWYGDGIMRVPIFALGMHMSPLKFLRK